MYIDEYIDSVEAEAIELIKKLAAIPAPSMDEGRRVSFITSWLRDQGIDGFVDEAKNVVIPYNADSAELDVFAAHTDVVFPDTAPFTVVEGEDFLAAPGIGDDTANVVALLLFARFVIKNRIRASKGVLFVCNSCEEGRGDLKGVKQLCRDYKGRIATFTSFDCNLGKVVSKAVGSERFEVAVKTIGGHSYSAFGNPNAICELSRIIIELSKQAIPNEGKTTFNIGTIEGGTSVNTIAENAMCTYEYRSDESASISFMRSNFEGILKAAKDRGVDINATSIGVRPCSSGVDSSFLYSKAKQCLEAEGIGVTLTPSSTDCNIPLSLGIPSVAFGLIKGEGAHTREEYITPSTLKPGFRAGLKYMLEIICK